MAKLYGTSKSRSARSLWALEELGVKYEHIPTEVPKAKGPDHLKINPNGHIPALEDDGVSPIRVAGDKSLPGREIRQEFDLAGIRRRSRPHLSVELLGNHGT